MSIRVLIAAGGTGGHVYPGIAIAEAIQERFEDAHVEFVGTELGLEKRLLPTAGYQVNFVRASRVKNAGVFERLKGILRLPIGMLDASKVISRVSPDVVVSVGGYSAAPTVLMSWLRRIPTVTVEPNAIPGLTNRVLGRLAQVACVGFQNAATWYRAEKVRVLGVPLRRSVVQAISRARRTAADTDAAFRLLVFGGSQGARFLNERVPECVAGLNIEIVHQTGEADHGLVQERYQTIGVKADVRPYIEDMAAAYANCDLAIARAGASSVAELAVSGTPALLVPFPYAADDHQAANGAALAASGGARMIRQSEWVDAEIADWLKGLANSPAKLTGMANAAAESGRPEAARHVVDECVQLLQRRGVRLMGWVA